MAGVTCRISFMVTIPTSFPPSITASRRILRWFMNLAASFTVAPGLMLATGFDIVCATFSSDGRTFLAATLCTMSLSVIIPAGIPDLSTMITQPMSCLPISLDTPATVSVSFAVIGGRDIMSRTRMSGSASWTDNARWPSFGFYKIFLQ